MPIRTTEVAVKTVLDVSPTEPLPLAGYIETASSIIDDVCVDTDTYTYTPAKLELIERWLSAHCFALNRRRTWSQSIGNGAVSHVFDKITTELNFNNTVYGQTAMAIDTNGALAALNEEITNPKNSRISLHYLGTDCEC